MSDSNGMTPPVESCTNCDFHIVRIGKMWCRRFPPTSSVIALREAMDKVSVKGPQAAYNLQQIPSRPETGPTDWCGEWVRKGSRNHA